MSIEREAIETLAAWALSACDREGLDQQTGFSLVESLFPAELGAPIDLESILPSRDAVSWAELGPRYEQWLGAAAQRSAKKRRGSFYTPASLGQKLCRAALDGREVRSVLDPSCGAGAILLEALDTVAPEAIHGVDIDPVAVWLARISLALRSARIDARSLEGWRARVRVGDALAEDTFAPDALFDAVIGNPPWVSYAGRSAEPLTEAQRKSFRQRFFSFSGFPTAQGMFIERAVSLLREGGRLALLVPTPVADLHGYRATREALSRRAVIDDPLEELGFDQFESVVQPTVIVAATARAPRAAHPASDHPWKLTSHDSVTRPALARSLLAKLSSLPRFAASTFGEGGFQSAGEIARTHIGPVGADPRFTFALREGADVFAFACRAPSIALDCDPAALAAAGCTVRAMEFYQRVTVLIRQTARYPIACRHEPVFAFRNSLIAGFSDDPDVLCALLNSKLLRALHLSSQRDGRQTVFPQLKVAHLRALPAPPEGRSLDALRSLAQRAALAQRTRLDAVRAYGPAPKTAFEIKGREIVPSAAFLRALSAEKRPDFERALASVREAWASFTAAIDAIDAAVFSLYDVSEEERETVLALMA